MTKYYPVMLNIEGKNCTVIGGGRVAQRKVKSLLEHGARATVIAPKTTEKLEKMADEGVIHLKKRPYEKGDLKGSYLVYVATDIPEVNEACYQEAEELGIMINIVDVPQLCDFIVPAIHRQGSLTLTVSTDGKSPMFSRRIRDELEVAYGPQYQHIIDTMGEIRKKALEEIDDIEVRRELFHRLTYDTSVNAIADFDSYREKMWRIYESCRNREGCDKDENN
ncbi:precorrin-2 dehydrogenase/sirohydrochlorin ferrochelatase family protein [Alkaliphilus hydrothermalis]|uniref:precorrin-2 dehydrogenase n=1 Tax=Alkaliphilus hydrothermalis TaxID=1482730 RepID=A0ABS2NP47_9FIRM|nr:bifunctional precorrin-2 dehydrogenase/sirohydrochlorin ferrochelatase [Alkaliphilus hydrothermalis]MBM7614715.1 precorrin-2 dehydrogenase/sirohydrochlorin ferrochelatase [Alkaliphilus hydrothermalis]